MLSGNNPPGYLIQQGLSDSAANAANTAQQQSINQARNEYTKGATSAINNLLSAYGNAFNLQSSQIQSGSMANSQLNYLLGLPALNAPTKPVKTPGMSDQEYANRMAEYNAMAPAAEYSQKMGQAKSGDISGIVSNLPGFQAQMDQGTQAIQNSASASGMLRSGNVLQELQKFGMGMQSDYYNKYIDQLFQQASVGNNALNNAANQNIDIGKSVSNIQADLGTNMANASLASGQAQSQGILSKLSSYTNRYVPTIDPSYTQQQNQAAYNKALQDYKYGVAKEQSGNAWYKGTTKQGAPNPSSFGLNK